MSGAKKRGSSSTGVSSASKKAKRAKASSSSLQVDKKKNDQGNAFWELSVKRRVTVESFKGKTLVAIREFYEKDGKMLPARNGISLTPEQFWALLKAVPGIQAELEAKGETEQVVSDNDHDSDDDDNDEEEDAKDEKANKDGENTKEADEAED